MRIGILETGGPPESFEGRFGDYPAMFRRLLGDGFDYAAFDVAAGALPARSDACDAWVITGSAAGVYDDLRWIEPLKDLLREAKGRAALVGVCFGHQIMAEAFGGKVAKSDKGWGVGLHTYEVLDRQPWMDAAKTIAAPASHQDQVVVLPPAARVVAASAFTPFGALAYEDQPAISIQLHPEFEPAYAKALIENRRGARYSDAQADAAVASLDAPDDRARVGTWIREFLRRAP
ncbi:MAG TPA: type 1 glutamine amidotransferase [Caulobacteraceae bacterium]|jgi:GMP synthase-like glutamine amidotransferase|nr:type 1 glutamine amidotransferase [Caulobacteraceae bacterium]